MLTADEKDTGDTVALWAKGGKFAVATGSGQSMTSAIATAVRAAGATALEVGGELAVAWTGEGPTKPGMNPAKLYTAAYRPPERQPASVDVNDLFNS